MDREVYESLAALLAYPQEQQQAARLDRSLSATRSVRLSEPAQNRGRLAQSDNGFVDALTAHLGRFEKEIAPLSLPALQELFIQSFDLSPLCSLEMGWHLFGENYDRGLLLVKMRQLLRQHGIAESTELPDHLSHALRLLPRMEQEDATYFVEAIVWPALNKMLNAIREKRNPYEHLLSAISATLRADFPELPAEQSRPPNAPELRVLA